MGRRLAVFALWVLVISFLAFDHSGTELASKRQEVEKGRSCQTVARLPKQSTAEEDLESEAGLEGLERPSHLEHTRNSPSIARLPYNDLALLTVPNSKSAQGSALQKLQEPLDANMGLWKKPQQEQEAEKEKRCCGFQGPRSTTRRGQCGARVQLLSHSSSVDSNHTTGKVGSSQRRCRHACTTTTDVATTTSSDNRFDRRGPSHYAHPSGAAGNECDIVGGTVQQAQRVGDQEQEYQLSEGAFAWAFESTSPPQGASQQCCHQDIQPRSGMEQMCSRVDAKSPQACLPVQRMQSQDAHSVRGEAQGTGHDQARHASCLGFAFGEDARCSGSPAGCTGCGPTNSSDPIHGSRSRDPGHFRRRNGSGAHRGWTNRRQAGSSSESQKATSLSTSSITRESGATTPESQSRDQVDVGTADDVGRHNCLAGDSHFVHLGSCLSDCGFDRTCNFDFPSRPAENRSQCENVGCLTDDTFVADQVTLFETELDSDDDFTWLDVSDRLPSRKTVNRHVTFHPMVQVGIFHGQDSFECEIELDSSSRILRGCWHLHGFGSSMSACTAVLSSNRDSGLDQSSFSSPRTDSSTHLHPSVAQETHRSIQPHDTFLSALAAIRNAVGILSRVVRVDTWLLVKGHAEVCPFAREISVKPDATDQEIEWACRRVWHDIARESPFRWHVVRNSPSSGVVTKVHLILVQGVHDPHQAHLVHLNQWPILGKFRAVLSDVAEPFNQMLIKAGARLPRSAPLAQFAGFYNEQGNAFQLDHHDRIDVDCSNVLYAYVRFPAVQVNEASDADSSLGELSTSAPDTSSDADESDEFSWVSTHSAVAHFDQHGPFPWEDPDFLDNEILDDLGDEPNDPTLEFPDEHRAQMRQQALLVRATTPAQQDSWVAVTFGLGIADLGRRDVDFRWDQLGQVPELIKQLWHDHLEYADAQLLFVTPQPEGLHVRKYLVFLLVVEYG